MRRIVKDRMWINPEQFQGPMLCRRLFRSFDQLELLRDDLLDNPNAVPSLLWVSNDPLWYNQCSSYAPVVILCQETYEIGYMLLGSRQSTPLAFNILDGTRIIIQRFGTLHHNEIPPNWQEYAAKGVSELPAFGR